MQGTAEFHHQIADALLPQADPVFHDATALDTAVDMLNPQPTAVQLLVRGFGGCAATRLEGTGTAGVLPAILPGGPWVVVTVPALVPCARW